jgi:hypothetical protein
MMVRPEDEVASVSAVFGGRPSAPGGRLEWPRCRECEGAMQFLGQLRLDDPDRLALVFMCQNEPGLCDEWEPFAGGNAVVLVDPSAPQLVDAPAGETTRPERYGVELVATDARYEDARYEAKRPREIVGQLGGEPAWLQADETPACPTCSAPMDFAAQIEQGPNHRTEMNFGGGGSAYLFHHCASGVFLWQS